MGTSSQYDGTSIVKRSIKLGSPIIYVSMNYRLTGFGFMPGKEVKAAGVGNLGLQDRKYPSPLLSQVVESEANSG